MFIPLPKLACRWTSMLWCAWLCAACAWPPACWAAADPAETRALHALFDRQWEDQAQRYPEFSTFRGETRFNDRLSDASPEAVAAADAQVRAFLDEARRLRKDLLEPTDQVSLDMFIGQLERQVAFQAYPGWRSLRMGVLGGAQSDLGELLQVTPMATVPQAEQLLARLALVPGRMAQEIDWMRRGMALGWVTSHDVLDRAVAQIDGQLPASDDRAAVEASVFYAPFKRLGAAIPPAERERLQAAGLQAVTLQVLPAVRALRAFTVDEYRPQAPAQGALRGYPGGPEVYDVLVAVRTTTPLKAAEIHAIGQRELARVRSEMEAVMRKTGFTGDFPAFITFLNTEPRFQSPSPEALLAGYRDIAKRIDAELPRLFVELPRMPYGVRAMPAHMGPDRAEYYDAPALDGSRPGWFNANAQGWRKKPTWSMATMVAHEAVPGHHLQIARGQELRNLPAFRRGGFGYTAFVEGWALYAETLGQEIGLYDDPYSRFGHLQGQAWRAARLVVDTGIHSLGWTRQQAVDFMAERTGLDRGIVASEVDRYTSTPGQALAYMIGELKILELRQRAQARMGAAFDLRRFNNAVIDQGALPLDTLERVIDAWIAASSAAPAKAP